MSVELNTENHVKSPATGLPGDEFFDAEDGEALKMSDDELLSKINKELSDITDASKVDTNGFKILNTEDCQIAADENNEDETEQDKTSTISESKPTEEDDIKKLAATEKELDDLLELSSDVKSGAKDDEDLLEDDLSDIEEVESKANEIEAKIDALLSEEGESPKLPVDGEPKIMTEPQAEDTTAASTVTLEAEPSSTETAEKTPEDEPMLEEPDSEAPEEAKSADPEVAVPKEQEKLVGGSLSSDATKESMDTEPSKTSSENAAKDSELLEEELKEDDLLEDCASSDAPTIDMANGKPSESETSSSNGDTPEESDAEKQSLNQIDDKAELKAVNDTEKEEKEISEKMDVDEDCAAASPKSEDKLVLCVVMDEDEKPAAVVKTPKRECSVPVKFNFMRKFATKVGKLSRSEVEELLVQKIAESMIYGSDNSELRTRIENQEKINEGIKKQLENVKKQYKDLQMIHDRVMKDLKDRPDAPITPVKITRAVGLQVYQPALRGKQPTPPQATPPMIKRSHESPANGTSPPDAKRKKTVKTTPLRPPLSDKARAALARQEANEELKLRTKTMKTVMNVNVPSSITVVPLNALQNGNKGSSIDLTDDVEDGSSNKTKAHQPPPLTAIRAAMAAGKSVPVPKMPSTQPTPIRQNQVRIPYNVIAPNIAPLPPTPSQSSRPGWKKIPPRPVIKISKVNSGIIVSWFLENLSAEQHANILSYQIYAYEQSSNGPALTENWRHVGDVKALALPMAVTLTQFQEGRKYYFAVRAQDCHKRFTNFSLPRTWA